MRVLFFVLLLSISVSPALAAKEGYICPMHPHISGEEGNVCPICGMTLVPKVEETTIESSHKDGDTAVSEGTFKIDPSYVHVLGVKTAEVKHHEFGKGIRAFGRIAVNTRREYQVNMQSEGWVKTLKTDAVGDEVKKGDLLFTFYSQDIMGAQSDYLVGSRGNPEQKLSLVGMDDKAIALLKQKRRMMEETPFHAPTDGIITELNIRKGSFVPKGGLAITIQDFFELWVNVDVPMRDIQFLSIGTPVEITMPETSDEYSTTIDYIHPVNDPQSRTVTVRLILENPEGHLKPETYVDAVFNADAKSRLAVPVEAVLYGSMGAYVMESVKDGYFRPVMVDTGITANGLTEIKGGLSHGQRIVTSGQFMLDAESNLKGGMKGMGHNHGGDEMPPMDDMNADQPQSTMGGMDHGQH